MLLPCPGSDQYSMPADILLHPGSVKFWPRKHGSSSWCVLSEENHHGWVCRGSLWTSSPIFPNRYLRFALTALPTPTSFVFAALLTVLTFAGMQMFKNNLASSEWMTILGGFIGSQLFIFLLTVSFSLVTSRSMALNSTIGWIYLIPAISDFVILRQSFTQYGISLFQQYKFCSVLHRVSEISVFRDVLPELEIHASLGNKGAQKSCPPPPPPTRYHPFFDPPPLPPHTHTHTHTHVSPAYPFLLWWWYPFELCVPFDVCLCLCMWMCECTIIQQYPITLQMSIVGQRTGKHMKDQCAWLVHSSKTLFPIFLDLVKPAWRLSGI